MELPNEETALPLPRPTFDLAACTATGWCVAACPTQCLLLWNDQPELQWPAACIGCGICASVCPRGAVQLPPLLAELPASLATSLKKSP